MQLEQLGSRQFVRYTSFSGLGVQNGQFLSRSKYPVPELMDLEGFVVMLVRAARSVSYGESSLESRTVAAFESLFAQMNSDDDLVCIEMLLFF